MPLFLVIVLLFLPVSAIADSLTGFVDLTYSNLSSKTTDSTGQTTKTDSISYFQRYTLFLDKTIYPKLKLNATGIFEKEITQFKSEGQDTDTKATRFKPSATLTLQDPLYKAAVGYYLREETVQVSRAPTVTTVNEEYNGLVGWRPAGLPSMDMRFSRTNTYDTDRTFLDTVKDYVSLTSQYAYKGFDLRYFGTYTDTTNKLSGFETEDVTHNGRGTYTNSFLGGRANFSTSYNIAQDTVTTRSTGNGTGAVSTQVFPSEGLSVVSDSVIQGAALDPNPALIDNDLTASAGINIGTSVRAGANDTRNIGLHFSPPTDVNNLLIWVDQDLTSTVSASFSWAVYTSPGNTAASIWTQVPGVTASFDPFLRRFSLDFTSVKATFIKAVVRPLNPTVAGAGAFPDIRVTELQAFNKQVATPGQRTEQKFTTTTQVSNTDLRYRIFDSPLLYYDFSYYFNKKDNPNQEISTLSNALSATYRFSRIFLGTARFAREDGEVLGEKRTAYVYNATITATPLRTLTNSLVYSGRNEDIAGATRDSYSIFLNNTAQLYQGLSMNLNGGVTNSHEVDGSNLKSTIITLGSSIVPHKTMTWTLYLTRTSADQSRPGVDDVSTESRRADLTVTYNPFRTLYLLSSFQVVNDTVHGGGQGTQQGYRTLQNYGLNWSPFPNGALQFRFSYNETRRPQDQVTDRFISPGVRYMINSRSFLDLSYQISHNDTAAQTVDTQIFTANVKIFF